MCTNELITTLDYLVKESKGNKGMCFAYIDEVRRKDQLIKLIKAYIGIDGEVYFEHGYKYKPTNFADSKYDISTMNCVGYDYILIKGKENKPERLHIEKLTNNQLRDILKALYDYYFFCKYVA